MNVRLRDGPLAQKRLVDRTTFDTDFLWLPPDEEGIRAMRRWLQQMLKAPTNRVAIGYLLAEYLKIPQVAESVQVEELLSALPARRQLAFSGGNAICDYLNEHFHNDPAVVGYVSSQLKMGDPRFVEWELMKLHAVWDEGFIEPLVEVYQRHSSTRETILRYLRLHGCPQADDAALARRLSEVFYENGAVQSLREKQFDVRGVVRLLGMTRDRRVITDLIPLLEDRRSLSAQDHRHAFGGAVSAPERVCDAAMSAICTVLGEKVENAHGQRVPDPEAVTRQRDELIAKLRSRLSQIPEFAGLLAKPNQAGLSAEMLVVADRWRAAGDPQDFLKLKPLIKAGDSAKNAREILGLPLDVTRDEQQGERWLYLRPSFRRGLGDFHYLKVDGDDHVVGWDVQHWPDAYDPNKSPALGKKVLAARRDLGAWDDVIILDELSYMIGRRGLGMFAVPLDAESKKFGEYEEMQHAKVLKGLAVGDKVWLFCEAKDLCPFLIELPTGRVTEFAIKGLRITRRHSPTIQSLVQSGANTAVLMLSGGDPATWPRPGNRPVYFWVDLNSGAWKQMPIGWDLSYCSPDQRIAVFGSESGLKAIDTHTGEGAAVYDNAARDSVPFNWTNMDPAQPLIDSRGRMIGLTAKGQPYRFATAFTDTFMPSAKMRDDQVAFHIRGRGGRGDSSKLWLAQLQNGTTPRLISHSVTQYDLLSGRYCVFVADVGAKPFERHAEAFVFDARADSSWNVLDGVEGLPESPCTVQIYPGFGEASGVRVLLCEIRCLPAVLGGPPGDSWQQWVMLSSTGTREVIDMPEDVDKHRGQNIRPHPSGVLIYTIVEHSTEDSRDVYRQRLYVLGSQTATTP